MATVNIKLGNNTLNGVDTIKVTDASDTSSKIDFVYGTTPSGSVGIKVGDNTLTGVNQINVMGTDDTYKSFGYAPSGYSVSGKNYVIYTNCCYYSTDGGTTWIDASTIPTGQLKDFTITGITQLMVKCFENSNNEYGYMAWGSVGISGLDKSSSNPAIYDFGTLTADITGMELWASLD